MASGANVLVAVAVPWQVSPSSGIIGVHMTEEGVSVTLSGFLGKHVAEAEIARLEAAGETEDLLFNSAGYRAVAVDFLRFGGCRLQPQLSREHLFNPARFDDSQIFGSLDRDSEGRNVRERWEATGLCPDPRMYEVQQSDWLSMVADADPRLKHWLVLGHSAVVEMLAVDYSWTFAPPLPSR